MSETNELIIAAARAILAAANGPDQFLLDGFMIIDASDPGQANEWKRTVVTMTWRQYPVVDEQQKR